MCDYITVCEDAARQGGAVLLEKIGKVVAREKGRADLVTEADIAAQATICRTIWKTFPDHQVLGEEEGLLVDESAGAEQKKSPYRWIIDPLDGTTNFVHEVPHFSVSVALECSGDLLAAVVFNPISKECFTATAGKGARLNGREIGVSTTKHLPQALAAIGFPPSVPGDSPDLALFLRALTTCQALRRTGSAALNLAYVAAGRFDACWSFCTKPWDVAAGALLIVESGGVVTAPGGGAFDADKGSILAAATPELHCELIVLGARAGLW